MFFLIVLPARYSLDAAGRHTLHARPILFATGLKPE